MSHASRSIHGLVAFAVCASAAAIAAPAAPGAREPFLVPVSASATGFGPFVEQPGRNGVRPLVRAFGNPSSTVLARDTFTCTLRWTRLGVARS